jgi:hypothetical protein
MFNRCNLESFSYGYSKEWPRPLHRAEPEHQLQPRRIINRLVNWRQGPPHDGRVPWLKMAALVPLTHASKQH